MAKHGAERNRGDTLREVCALLRRHRVRGADSEPDETSPVRAGVRAGRRAATGGSVGRTDVDQRPAGMIDGWFPGSAPGADQGGGVQLLWSARREWGTPIAQRTWVIQDNTIPPWWAGSFWGAQFERPRLSETFQGGEPNVTSDLLTTERLALLREAVSRLGIPDAELQIVGDELHLSWSQPDVRGRRSQAIFDANYDLTRVCIDLPRLQTLMTALAAYPELRSGDELVPRLVDNEIQLQSAYLDLRLRVDEQTLEVEGYVLPSLVQALEASGLAERLTITPAVRFFDDHDSSRQPIYRGGRSFEATYGELLPREGGTDWHRMEAQFETLRALLLSRGYYETTNGFVWVSSPAIDPSPAANADARLGWVATVKEIGDGLLAANPDSYAHLRVSPTEEGLRLFVRLGGGSYAHAEAKYDPETQQLRAPVLVQSSSHHDNQTSQRMGGFFDQVVQQANAAGPSPHLPPFGPEWDELHSLHEDLATGHTAAPRT